MKRMKVLVACEYSGIVRDAFIDRGHYAMSCDLLPTESPRGSTGDFLCADGKMHRLSTHHQGNVIDVIESPEEFCAWDLMIAHPPCTYLCSSGLHWNKKNPTRAKLTEQSLWFVAKLLCADIPRIALENPVGCIGTRIRPADQYIHPYEFGHDASKKTGLWLKGLPLLKPTEYVEPRWLGEKPRWGNQTDSGQNRLPPSETRWKDRSKTYQGIADAMAEQWSIL